MIAALRAGLLAAWRSRSLALLLLAWNASTALLLAAPLAIVLDRDLTNRGAGPRLVEGFDYDWWRRFSAGRSGFGSSFRPDMLGAGFVFRNLEALVEGRLPGHLFADDDEAASGPEPLVLGLGAGYFLVQTLLAGGILSTLRAPRGGFVPRAFAHACGHYVGPMARVTTLALALDALVFLLGRPLAAWCDGLAREALTEASAFAWSLACHALVLAALLSVHLASGYAKALIVLEERRSAALALLSALGFLAERFRIVVGHFAAVVLLGIGVVTAFVAGDGLLPVTGYRTQLVALAMMQSFVLLRISLRLALAGGQLHLLRRLR
jgi:hypothetical protein